MLGIEELVIENAVHRGPNTGDQCRVIRIGHGGKRRNYAIRIGAFHKAAQSGNAQAVCISLSQVRIPD